MVVSATLRGFGWEGEMGKAREGARATSNLGEAGCHVEISRQRSGRRIVSLIACGGRTLGRRRWEVGIRRLMGGDAVCCASSRLKLRSQAARRASAINAERSFGLPTQFVFCPSTITDHPRWLIGSNCSK